MDKIIEMYFIISVSFGIAGVVGTIIGFIFISKDN